MASQSIVVEHDDYYTDLRSRSQCNSFVLKCLAVRRTTNARWDIELVVRQRVRDAVEFLVMLTAFRDCSCVVDHLPAFPMHTSNELVHSCYSSKPHIIIQRLKHKNSNSNVKILPLN